MARYIVVGQSNAMGYSATNHNVTAPTNSKKWDKDTLKWVALSEPFEARDPLNVIGKYSLFPPLAYAINAINPRVNNYFIGCAASGIGFWYQNGQLDKWSNPSGACMTYLAARMAEVGSVDGCIMYGGETDISNNTDTFVKSDYQTAMIGTVIPQIRAVIGNVPIYIIIPTLADGVYPAQRLQDLEDAFLYIAANCPNCYIVGYAKNHEIGADYTHITGAGFVTMAAEVSSAMNSLGLFAEGNRFFGCGDKKQIVVSVPPATIPGTSANFVYPILLSSLDSDFLTACRSDRLDIKVYSSTGQRLKRDVSSVDGVLQWLAPTSNNENKFYLQTGSGVSFANDTGTWIDSGHIFAHLYRETSGAYIDSAGLHNATVVNTGDVTRNVSGKLGKAITLGGTNGHLSIADADDLSFAPNLDFTFLTHVRYTGNGATLRLFSKCGTNKYELYFGMTGNQVQINLFGGASSPMLGRVTTSQLGPNFDLLLAGVYRSGALEIWGNGTRRDAANDNNGTWVGMTNYDKPVLIGAIDLGTIYYSEASTMCRTRLFNRALSQAEILGYSNIELNVDTAYIIGASQNVVYRKTGQPRFGIGFPRIGL